jgi:hypothetical protein
MRARVACGLALVLAFVIGCSPATGEQPPAEPTYPEAQAWALDDGVVTDNEYREAIDGFVSCMRDAGYPVTDPVVSPIDGLTLLYDMNPSGPPEVWNEKVEECDSSFVSMIEPTYVESRDQVMEPSLRSATARCLNDKGVELSGNERNVKDFSDSADDPGNIVMQCVSTSLRQLFPEYPTYLRVRW